MAEWKCPVFGHGGDYNPDQWLHDEHVLEEDVRLMKLSHCNIMSIGIFAWAALEPEEGVYTFDWLERVIDRLYENGISVLLATPSGARPAWMSQRYPEVLRVREDGLRNTHGIRHNHCFTSPTYRLKVHEINTRLAERFGKHPGVVGWHVSNEFSGCCYCDLCKNAFRDYLKREYGSLDEINRNWWTAFWSHTYTDWSQIDPPSRYGEDCVMGLNLAWQRFITYQTVDFIKNEIEPLRRLTPDLPVTTNFMNRFDGLDYSKFKDVIDIACWDSYPLWGRDANSDAEIALNTAFYHDYIRSILQKPWVLMESTPSVTNWQEVSKLKRPGMHLLSSMLAVAHGADSIQYFQWRKSRGASEKLHGAVVDHVGHENTRVFRDVTSVGEYLLNIKPVLGSIAHAQAAIIYDCEDRWAIKDARGDFGAQRQFYGQLVFDTLPDAPFDVTVDAYFLKPALPVRAYSPAAEDSFLLSDGSMPAYMNDSIYVSDSSGTFFPTMRADMRGRGGDYYGGCHCLHNNSSPALQWG